MPFNLFSRSFPQLRFMSCLQLRVTPTLRVPTAEKVHNVRFCAIALRSSAGLKHSFLCPKSASTALQLSRNAELSPASGICQVSALPCARSPLLCVRNHTLTALDFSSLLTSEDGTFLTLLQPAFDSCINNSSDEGT